MAVLSPEQYQVTLYYATIDILVAQYRNQIIGASVVELKYNPPTTLAPLFPTQRTSNILALRKAFKIMASEKVFFLLQNSGLYKKRANDLQLTVWAFNEKARAFYESLGLKNS